MCPPTSFFCPMSCRNTVLWMPKYAEGPYGRCVTTMPSAKHLFFEESLTVPFAQSILFVM